MASTWSAAAVGDSSNEPAVGGTAPSHTAAAAFGVGDLETEKYLGVETVRALHHLALKPKCPKSNFTRLHVMAEKRAELDAEEVKKYERFASAVAEEIESSVISASRELRSNLDKYDRQIEQNQFWLGKDENIIPMSHDQVLLAWDKLDQLLRCCTGLLDGIEHQLADMEELRRSRVGGRLREVVEKRLAISSKSAGEIERAAEGEAYELNQVIIKNKVAHAELTSSLRKVDAVRRQKARHFWMKRLADWRSLRHDKALGDFRFDLASNTYFNPPLRQAAYEKFRSFQEQHRESREALVQELSEMCSLHQHEAGPARLSLSSTKVSELENKFTEINALEDHHVSELEEKLMECSRALSNDLNRRREELRREIHEYGALNPEPSLAAHGREISSTLFSDAELDDWFRMAGGLKVELQNVVAALHSPDIIYGEVLGPARDRVETILAGSTIGAILDGKGKGTLRKSVLDSTEALRCSRTKEEIWPLIPNLVEAASNLARALEGDDSEEEEPPSTALLTKLLMNAAEELGRLMHSTHDSASESAGTNAKQGEGDVVQPSQDATSFSLVSSTTGDVSMVAIRRSQKMLALLASSSDLPPESIQEIQQIQASLRAQHTCNEAVDAVIEEHCHPAVEARENEHSVLMMRSIAAMRLHGRALKGGSERLCAFYRALALEIECHEKAVYDADEAGADALFERKEDFRLAHEERERQITHHTDRIRKAANDEELEASFDKVLQLLNEVEKGYREYHAKALKELSNHISVAEREGERHERALKCHLCLIPMSESPDSESNEVAVARAQEREGVAECDKNEDQEGGKGTTGEPFPQLESVVAADILLQEQDYFDDLAEEEAYDPWQKSATDAAKEESIEVESVNEGSALAYWKNGFNPDELSEELDEVAYDQYLERMSSSFVLLAHKTTEELPAEERAAYYSAKDRIEDWRRKKAAQQRAEDREKNKVVPQTPTGEPATLRIALPLEKIATHIASARHSLLSVASSTTANRMSILRKSCDEIAETLTDELEERVRCHWPRKGRVEVGSRQPRQAELSAHKVIALRFMNQTRRKLSQQQKLFEKQCSECAHQSDEFVNSLADIRGRLHEAANLAALQGTETRVKRLNASFVMASNAAYHRISKSATEEPARLSRSCDELLRTCIVFDEGGSYDVTEVESLRKQLDELRLEIQDASERRSSETQAIREQAEQALRGMDEFHDKFAFYHRELSLQQGLGKKYGAPRRSAQERLRAEYTLGERAAENIDRLLGTLNSLCTSCQVPTEPSVPALSSQMRVCLLSLRAAMCSRGRYLEFLIPDSNVDWSAPLKAQDPYGDIVEPDAAADVPESPHATLRKALEAIEKGCRISTRELYKSEGKESLLGEGESSVPDSLEQWLDDMRSKALGPNGELEKAQRRFREQVMAFEELVGKNLEGSGSVEEIRWDKEKTYCSALAASILSCTRPTIAEQNKVTWDMLRGQLASSSACRQKHLNNLRPSMGTPQAASELAKLSQQEADRASQFETKLETYEKALLESAAKSARVVAQRITLVASAMLQYLDTAVTLDDLHTLPGDENVLKKRKSLKRLEKALRTGRGPTPAIGSGRHWPKRTWSGVDASSLVEWMERASGGPNEEFKTWSSDLASSSTIDSFITSAHRAVVRARDDAMSTLSLELAEEVKLVETELKAARHVERQWIVKWKRLVSSLVQS